MERPGQGIGAAGASVPGPPWILGARGAPREAPENTLAALRRAVELGLDGVAYELRACHSGEAVLLADETLDRTTDARGALERRTLPELAAVDAGGWFDARFAGEPLALFEEALALEGNQAGRHPQHLIELRSVGLAAQVARALGGVGRSLSARVATRHHGTCSELRDLGLEPLLIADAASDELARFLRRERISACGLAHEEWGPSSREGWPSERWALDVDDPDALLRACRLPINGLTTREPRRALAARALAFLAPHDERGWPLRAPLLAIEPGAQLAGGGEWAGHWDLSARVHNPFGFPVRVVLDLLVRRGAFETHGLPAGGELGPGEEVEVPFGLVGGSWSPGGDPLLFAHLRWDPGPGRPGDGLSFDATLQRVRTLVLGASTLRVGLLPERPGEAPATMTLRRRGGVLLAAIESAGGLADARALLSLDGREHVGAGGVRASLPADFARRPGGVPFSVGLIGLEQRAGRAVPRLRRWAGGLPVDGDSGAPGRLVAAGQG